MRSPLDRWVSIAHRVRVFGKEYHPYFLATDLAAVGSLALAYFFTRRFPEFPFLAFVGEFFAMTALYKIFLVIKARLFKIRSRSFLQDTLLFLLPTYAILNRVLGFPLAAAFDLVGLMLPLYLGFVRIGCFLGGCCYGVSWDRGVLYPREIFRARTGCRTFHPGEYPGERVLPVQLAESAGNLALFAALSAWMWREPAPRGFVLPLYLLGYSLLRFGLDFFRRSSARPRIGAFSEAQIFCFVSATISLVALAWLRGALA